MTASKIHTLSELEKILAGHRKAGRKVVLCHGVFDLMHPGHVLHFQAAKKFGDVLVITVTPDKFVKKGPGRPVFPHRLRLETLAALQAVDYVALNEWPTAVETLHRLKPDFYVKGSDYADPTLDLTGKIKDEKEAVEAHGGRLVFTDEETFSSSNLINRFFSKLPPAVDEYIRGLREEFSAGQIISSLEKLADIDVLVVGEAIHDQYHYCTPLGKSPKETIIATKHISDEDFAGGSIAIANHLAGLCRRVTLVSLMGTEKDKLAYFRSKLLPNVKLVPVVTKDRPTVTKRRFVEPVFLTKMFEVQHLDDRPLPPAVEKNLRQQVKSLVRKHDMVLVSDFGHGMMTEALRRDLSHCGKFLAVNTQMNSANLGFNPATKYDRVDFLCLHEGELKMSLRKQYGDVHDLATELKKAVRAANLMVTRGPNGSLQVTRSGGFCHTPSLSNRIVDRTGAGDTFFALTAPCVFRNLPPELVGFIGNCAGAFAIETVCNREPVDPVALKKFISHLLA